MKEGKLNEKGVGKVKLQECYFYLWRSRKVYESRFVISSFFELF